MTALAMVLCAAGCLGDLVPVHTTQNQGTSGADLGDPGPAPGPGPTDDMGSPPPPAADLAGAPSGDLSPQSACIKQVAPVTDGHHNAGLDCMSCHNNNNPNISQFTVAGTLYSALTGGNAVAGATVEVTDSAGKVLPLLTGTNGNFYTEQPMTPPLTVRASACPADLHMQNPSQVGACNSCHNGTNQIHVP
jgi:hypothetical protein